MISSIIFDRHGVLDERKFSGLLDKMVEHSGKTSQEILEVLSEEFVNRDVGHMTGPNFWTAVKKKLDLSDRGVNECRTYILSIEPNTELREYIDEIKYEYRLGILSDCPEDKTEVIKKYLKQEGRDLDFDAIDFSSDTKRLKVQTFVYRNIARKMGMDIQNCLFVDDRRSILHFAKEAGMQTHLFTTVENLEKRILKD